MNVYLTVKVAKIVRRTGAVIVIISLWPILSIIDVCSIASPLSKSLTQASPYVGFTEVDSRKDSFILVGDTQSTSAWEFWRERNDKERKLIVNEIAGREPAFVAHLGDLTARGGSRKHWQEFDELNQPLREKKIPYFPVLGNHDLYGSDKKALEHYFERFPHLDRRRWYSFVWKNIGLVMIDSNFSSLTSGQIEEQAQWYSSRLEKFDQEPGVDYVIVCCHEPPFTNSKVAKPNKKSRVYFVDPFMRLRKPGLFFSGHNHSYERFEIGGKLFVVSGGGGGPRHKVAIDRGTVRYRDLFAGPELRFFHFCEIEIREKTLMFKVMALGHDGNFSVTDSTLIPESGETPAIR